MITISFVCFMLYLLIHKLIKKKKSVLARISKGQGATSENGTFMHKSWLKKGTLMRKD